MNYPGVNIRPPTDTEMPAIFELRWRGLYEQLGLTREMLEEESQPMDENSRTIHVAAFTDGEPISTVRVEPHPEHGDYVSLMATDEKWRHKGVGSTVLSVAEVRAKKELGIRALSLHASPEAVDFYENNGYHKNGQNRGGHTSNGKIVYVGMQKDLK